MADGGDRPAEKIRVIASINDADAAQWNDIMAAGGTAANPFVSHEFLRALENSKSASAESGWAPFHFLLEEGDRIVAAAPCYLKSHSFGEYVFDHHWADAYERAGGRYYPKLLCAVPFTPVPGPRICGASRESRSALAAALVQAARQRRLSSVHINFVSDVAAGELQEQGWLIRRGVQYHWFNRGYRSYDDFLAALSSRKRKTLKRERRDAAVGVSIRRLTGRNIDARAWDAFWTFYQDTGGRKWGRPYLSRCFFSEIAESMADRLMMVIAEHDGRPIAGALNFIGGDALYGRYWGRIEDRPFLHFEVCYHQAIEFAIERGLARVEAGAQGEHKIARGYEPVTTHSAHWIADSSFRSAIAQHLDRERSAIDAEIAELRSLTPFKAT
jgi:hypothetical protein